MNGLVIDLFAGGGGASVGIEQALGHVDIAINHDLRAIRMHEANHPRTKHYHTDVWEVDPREATGGQHVAFLWASPDCTYYSKARGGKPFRDRRAGMKRRALATVVVRWARAVKPDIIALENVEEFAQWGPLDEDGMPDKARAGVNFRRWVRQLEREGYRVEWKNLIAADYGTPTSRKRLFVVARCDGKPIVWPHASHGPSTYRTAADIIDWDLRCPSIFTRKQPLAPATLKRIARGVVEKVIMDPRPFVVDRAHTLVTRSRGERRGQTPRVPGLDKPLGTLCATGQNHALVTAHLSNFYGDGGQVRDLRRPMPTVTASGEHSALVTGSLFPVTHRGDARAHSVKEPLRTITTAHRGEHAMAVAYLARHWGGMTGCTVERPFPTVTTKGAQDQLVQLQLAREFDRSGEVRAFLMKYYTSGGQWAKCSEPMHTLRTKAGMGLVTVEGREYQITDIGMRMLTPRELFNAQGFPEDYRIEVPFEQSLSAAVAKPKMLTRTDQVFLCGNSVCPPVAAAIVRANVEAGR